MEREPILKILLLLYLIFAVPAFAGVTMSSAFTYQGRLMDASGSSPISGNLTVYFEVYNPSATCLLYSEHQSVNTTTTGGLFSVRIGEGTRTNSAAGYTNDPGYTFSDIFHNRDSFPSVSGSCPSGWVPGATDLRILRVHVFDGAITTTLSDQTLSPVPQAVVADTLSGVPLTGITLSWTTATRPVNPVANVTQGFNQTLTRFEIWNGAAWEPTTPKFSSAVVGDVATDGYVLKWNNTSKVWEPAAVGTLLGNPGGDISGTYASMSVGAIQGNSVSAVAPNNGEVLKWDSGSSAWVPSADAGANGVLKASGAGTTDKLTKWNSSDELQDSSIADDGTSVTFSTPLVMSANKITDLANPTASQDAMTLNYLEQYVEPGTSNGDILSWDNAELAWKAATPAASTLISGGTQNYIAKFNATGDNVVDSTIYDSGTRIGVKTNDPQTTLDVNGSIRATNSTYVGISIANTAPTTSSFPALTITSYRNGHGGQPRLQFYSKSGTSTAQTAIGSNNNLGQIDFLGRGDTTDIYAAGISARTEETFTDSSAATKMTFSTTASGSVSQAQRMGIMGSGSIVVGAGSTTPEKLSIEGNLALQEQASSASTPTSGWGAFYVKTDGKAYFKNDSGTEYDLTAASSVSLSGTANYIPVFTSGSAAGSSVIQQSGSLIGINVTPSYRLHVLGTSGETVGYFSDGTASCSITPATPGNVSCSSDERLKKNIETESDALSLERILQLQTVTYEWKHVDNGRHVGYIAQEVEKIAPEMVTTGDDGYKQVSYTGFIPWITGAIKEFHAKFAEAEEKNNREIASLREENAKLKEYLCLKDPSAPFCG